MRSPEGPEPAIRRGWLAPGWPATLGPGAAVLGDRPPQWRARRWSWFAAPWLLYLIYPLSALDHRHLVTQALGTVLLVAFAVLYLFGVPWALLAPSPAVRYRTIAALLALSGLLALVIGYEGMATVVFVASAAVVLLPVRLAGLLAVALATLVTALPPAVPSWHVADPQWQVGFSVLGAAFIGFGFMTLIRSNAALRAAREEVARLAADQERLRIARDIHDLLGHSLTTITVKAELARRLLYRDAGRAETEIADVEQLARQSLADVRAAVAGYREVSLAVELATAREVLSAAGIAAEVPRAVDQVPAELRELFGWAVREGVTNAVRHSRAERVRISVEERAVEVVDDGPPRAAASAAGPGRPPGAGLAGLAERAARLGGWVEAGPLDGQGYRLRVEVPADARGAPVPVGAPVAR
jgi:two-component system, NarL family, sensor histidine kinase DesK